MENRGQEVFPTVVLERHWLTEEVFEIILQRPAGFSFLPGQKVKVSSGETGREYTLINPPGVSALIVCVRCIAAGRFSPVLAGAEIGASFFLSAATGFFTYQTRERQAVCIATGTGIAPFLAYIRAGVRGLVVLHGAGRECDLLYRDEIAKGAGRYIPCISESKGTKSIWSGRVTAYLENCLAPGEYDFYLCGRRDMIRDAFRIIDRKFPGPRVFAETFF